MKKTPYKYKVNNKLRDGKGKLYGETDYGKKTITINKKIHNQMDKGVG